VGDDGGLFRCSRTRAVKAVDSARTRLLEQDGGLLRAGDAPPPTGRGGRHQMQRHQPQRHEEATERQVLHHSPLLLWLLLPPCPPSGLVRGRRRHGRAEDGSQGPAAGPVVITPCEPTLAPQNWDRQSHYQYSRLGERRSEAKLRGEDQERWQPQPGWVLGVIFQPVICAGRRVSRPRVVLEDDPKLRAVLLQQRARTVALLWQTAPAHTLARSARKLSAVASEHARATLVSTDT
jgi:hypothetical protein